MSQLQDLVQRVERLLLRYEELQRTNQLLSQQVNHLEQEKSLLQTRLTTARNRIDHLLAQIPAKVPSSQNTEAPHSLSGKSL